MQTATQNNQLSYVPFKNDCVVDFLIICQETEKAYKLKSFEMEEYFGKSYEVWVPKSAFETYTETAVNGVKTEFVTLKAWFKKKLTPSNDRITMQVLSLITK